MEINVNHRLPKSGTIGGNINIIISNTDNLHLKIVGKIGQYESMISSYIEIDSRESDHDFSIDLANKITYNTEETLPTQATFALLYNDAIITHKTIDFLILEPPEIESITLSGTTQEFATNSRMTFIIKIIKADSIEDSSLKFEFAESGVSDMSNPTIVNTYKPVKVSNTENDYTFVLIVPNNVAPGQKNLLVKILDTIGQESSLFIIPVTITQGRQITESSISCHKTQDMMPDNSEQMFKCNIDNIESNPVYYKAKVDTHIDSDYEQYDLDVRMEEIGNENEFNVYVTIPVQNEEKMSFSFAMISSNENTIIKYSDVSDIKIVPSLKIRQTSYDTFNVEKYSKMEFQFRLDYICEFESMKAQYKDSASNSEFQNVISKSALREINYYGYLYNAFYVTANIQQMTKIQFKFTDKFDRYVIIEYDLNLNEYINYSCQDNGNIGYQGDIIYIRCTAEKRLDSYAEREFNFVDCSNNNNYQLINTSSESSFEFYLTTPIITEDAPLKIYIKCVHNQNINQISVVKNEISPPLVIDFEMVEITEDSATVRVTASKDLSNNYDYTEYGIGTQETAQFHQFYDTDSYLTKDFNINEQWPSNEFSLTIRVRYNERYAYKSKVIKFDNSIKKLKIGRSQLKGAIYAVTAGYKVLLQHGSTSVQVKAEMGGKNYTLLKNNVVAFDFIEAGKLYCIGNEEITAIVFDLSDFEADDYVYMTGNVKLSIGTTNDSQYKFDPTKTLIIVATTFDGNGDLTHFSSNDYYDEKLSIKYYDIEGNNIIPSMKALQSYDNFNTIEIKCSDLTYQFNLNYEIKSSLDKEAILINSKVGSHKFASDTTNPEPGPNPGPNPEPKPKPGPNPGPNPVSNPTPKEDEITGGKTGGGNGGKIAGAIIGVLIVIAIVCVVIFFVMKKRKASEEKESNDDQVHEDTSIDDAVGV